jgi:hypothetical protein
MKKSFIALLLLGIALDASAALTPIGSYTITFSRGNSWSETQNIPVNIMTGTNKTGEDFYGVTVNGVTKQTQVYMQPTDGIPGAYTWYVNSPAAKDDPYAGRLLQGSGPLTITISNLKFDGYDIDEVVFLPKVTHVYYVGYSDGAYQPQYIPGAIPVADPYKSQFQRTPIEPIPGSGFYGTPYSTETPTGLTVTLPDLFVPVGGNWEVSFGMGFEAIPNVPEPATLLTLCLGIFAFRKKS